MGLDDYKHIGFYNLFSLYKDKPDNYINALPPSITVLDINKDGFPDLYITYPVLKKQNFIYINKQGKSFFRSKTHFSIRNVNQEFVSIRVAWIDFNNDGYEDIFIARVGCHSLYVYKPLQKTYREYPRFISYCSNPLGINIVDFNKDSYMDLVFANNIPYNRYIKSKIYGDEEAGGKNNIIVNHDGKYFLEDKLNIFKYNNHSTSVGISDINNDNWPDIYISNDMTYDRLYLNEKGKIKEVTFSWMKKTNHSFSGMNSEFVDLNNDHFSDLYVTGIFQPPYMNRLNLMWFNDSGRKFTEKAKDLNIHKCGFAWGAKFADFDNDGDLDLVVGNGFFRGNLKKPNNFESFRVMREISTSLFLKTNFLEKRSYSSNIEYAGFQKTCLFENLGEEFTDISEQANIKGLYNSRATIVLDFNNDGKMDFLTGNYNDKIKLYKNISQSDGNWIGFEIRNTDGAIAFGAKIILLTHSGHQLMREIYPQNGFGGQNDWRVHFGIGKDRPKNIKIYYRKKIKSFKVKQINEYVKITI